MGLEYFLEYQLELVWKPNQVIFLNTYFDILVKYFIK